VSLVVPRSATQRAQTARPGKPAQSAQPAALSDADVRTLQQQLADGAKPKVALLRDSAVGPAGTPVVVVTITEPAVGECVIVRVRGDDLPFAADELSWPVRKPRGRPRKEAAPAKNTAPAPAAAPAAAPPPPPPPPPPVEAEPPAPPQLAVVPETPAVPQSTPEPTPEPVAAPKKTVAKRRQPAGAPAPFSVSLRFTGKGWTSESSRSGKRSKPQPVSLAAMRALATRMDDVDLRNTIIASLDYCRREAEARAASLRAELEAAEIALAELDEAD
jgi:hypothetical protein